MLSVAAVLVAGLSVASAQTGTVPNTATDTAAVAAERATAVPSNAQSFVKGKAFDRFVNIMMENTDYTLAYGNSNYQLLAAQGLTLSNYYGVTHPSEPNYCAIYGGDHFGMDNDNFNQIPQNVSNIWDLLADKGISYAAYQENLPYTGFEGFQYENAGSGANNYVRKHNPPVLFNSNSGRFNNIKDLVSFQEDLANNDLAQHIFITPNMLNDAHDTGFTYGADWLYTFVAPLLTDKYFMNNTLLVINFDEDSTYTISNKVMTLLLSDTLPEELVGATDDSVYTHYSNLATVEANWGLDTLGRWDVAANVYGYVANLTGDVVRAPNVAVGDFFFNQSNPGAFAYTYPQNIGPMPVPNTTMEVNGRKVFSAVVEQWSGLQECTYYDAEAVIAVDGLRLPKAIPASCSTLFPTSSGTITSASATATSSRTATTLLTTTTAAPLDCHSNNCLRELQDARFSSLASAFCLTYTTTVNTAPSAIPTYLENCDSVVSAVSSACSCLMTATAI